MASEDCVLVGKMGNVAHRTNSTACGAPTSALTSFVDGGSSAPPGIKEVSSAPPGIKEEELEIGLMKSYGRNEFSDAKEFDEDDVRNTNVISVKREVDDVITSDGIMTSTSGDRDVIEEKDAENDDVTTLKLADDLELIRASFPSIDEESPSCSSNLHDIGDLLDGTGQYLGCKDAEAYRTTSIDLRSLSLPFPPPPPLSPSPSSAKGLRTAFGSQVDCAGQGDTHEGNDVAATDYSIARRRSDDRDSDEVAEKTFSVCRVCGDRATGLYFGALVCVPCKTFFLRYAGDNFSFVCKFSGRCPISASTRTQCKHCRYKKCLQAGMYRRVRPAQVQVGEGQQLCVVCSDVGNGVHFGALTCEGCKKFFRRGLSEHQSYICKSSNQCVVNPRTRNSCRACRFRKCIQVGMCREAIQMGRPSKLPSSSSTVCRNASDGPPRQQQQQQQPCSSSNNNNNNNNNNTNNKEGRCAPSVQRTLQQAVSFGNEVGSKFQLYRNDGNGICFGGPRPFSYRPPRDNDGRNDSTSAALSEELLPPLRMMESEEDDGADSEERRRKNHSYRRSCVAFSADAAQQPDSTVLSPDDPSRPDDQDQDEPPENVLDDRPQQRLDLLVNRTNGVRTISNDPGWRGTTNSSDISRNNLSSSTSSSAIDVRAVPRKRFRTTAADGKTGQSTPMGLPQSQPGGKRVRRTDSDSDSVSLRKRVFAQNVKPCFPFPGGLGGALSSSSLSALARENDADGSRSRCPERPALRTQKNAQEFFPVVESSSSPRITSSSSLRVTSDTFQNETTDREDQILDSTVNRSMAAREPRNQEFRMNATSLKSLLGGGSDDGVDWAWSDVERLIDFSRIYWLQPRLPDENLLFTDGKHWEVIHSIMPTYDKFVQMGGTINRTLRSDFEEWKRQNNELKNDRDILSEWIKQKVIPAYTIASVTYCRKLPGFSNFNCEDQITIIRLGQSPSRILAAALHWYDADQKNFRNFLSWRGEKVPPGQRDKDLFKQKLIEYAEDITSLELDPIEAALLNVLLIIATDYPNLVRSDIINETRKKILSTFRAYTTAKFGTPNNRLESLFSHIPELRRLGLLHHQMTTTKTMTAEEVERLTNRSAAATVVLSSCPRNNNTRS